MKHIIGNKEKSIITIITIIKHLYEERMKMIKDLLPIGSVVLLKEGKK